MTTSTVTAKNIVNFTTTVTLTNTEDEILAGHGYIPREQIRSVSIDNVIVSIHTHHLYLPADIIARLGLPLAEEMEVETATGIETVRIFQSATLALKGRETQSRCIELPEGESAIVGLIPLEKLRLKLDVENQQLVEVLARI